jgi:hypothetical protein
MTSIPRKRKVYVKEDGTLTPLDRMGGAASTAVYAASGTLLADGHLTISGSQFKTSTVAVASYDKDGGGTIPIGVQTAAGTITFKGDASEKFFYVIVNKNPVRM